MNVAQIGQLVWYVTGRFYSKDDTLQDVGYFLHLQGLESPLFPDGTKSEATAYFTFSSAPFQSGSVQNGDLGVGIDERGTFGIYLRETPGASFDDPCTFAEGTCIATFSRTSIVATTQIAAAPPGVGLLSNVFSAQLVSSTPFTFAGVQYDFRELVGTGVTQWGTAATEPETPPSGYAAVVPFVGSALRF